MAATRFMPEGGIFAGLGGFARFGPSWSTPARLPNLYSTGREIGDEYRYILDRRYAAKFPGNMLARPPLILNPWEKRSTDAGTFAARFKQEAQAMPGMVAGLPMASAMMSADRAGIALAQPGTSVDFLATAAPVTFNLVPDTELIEDICENDKDAVFLFGK